jgi:uncharacterized membrane protein (TIGR02234 family)
MTSPDPEADTSRPDDASTAETSTAADSPSARDAAAARSEYVRVLALLAVGAALLLLSYGQVWATATYAEPGLPRLVVELTGRDVQPVGGALPIVALAGIAGLVATRRVGRWVSGVVLALAGAAAAALALRFGLTWSSSSDEGGAIDRLVGEKVGTTVTGVPVVVSLWWLLAVVGGALVLVGGLLAVAHGARWPALGRRYERPSAAASARPAAPASAWDQLDQGVDPTLDAPGDPAADPARDTPMVSREDPTPPDVRPTDPDPMLGNGPSA